MVRYGSAFVACALAAALRLLLEPTLGDHVPYSTFYFAVAAIAWLCGLGPALATLLLGLVSATYLFIPPRGSFAISSLEQQVSLVQYLGVGGLVAFLVEWLHQERERAGTDHLTGVRNIRSFHRRLRGEVRLARKLHRPFTVAYLDVDDFKQVNDRFGHQRGDVLLRLVAITIQAQIRREDTVARVGGDEFAVLLSSAGPEAAQAFGRKIHQSLLSGMQEARFPVTVSIGVATFARPPDSMDDPMRKADELLYAVKVSSKNGVKHEVIDIARPVATQAS
jgi:diguanylate cyclase (GGDEF)-like protein